MAQQNPNADSERDNEDDIALQKDDETYYAVINEYPRIGLSTPPLVIAHEGADEAVFESIEKADKVRDRLAEEYDNEELSVKQLIVTDPPAKAREEQ